MIRMNGDGDKTRHSAIDITIQRQIGDILRLLPFLLYPVESP